MGCWIQGKFTGLAGYADDNAIMAPSQSGLQQMMNICEKFAKNHKVFHWLPFLGSFH